MNEDDTLWKKKEFNYCGSHRVNSVLTCET